MTGAQLHTLEGIVRVDVRRLAHDAATGRFEQEVAWHASYEAEQHLHHYGRSSAPVCWSLVGYSSGFASACLGQEIYFRETACAGQGEAACSAIGRDAAGWGSEIEALRAEFQSSRSRGRGRAPACRRRHPAQGAGSPRAAARAARARAQPAARARQPARDGQALRRRQPGHAGRPRARRARGAARHHRPRLRRERHRQGVHRPPDPRSEPARRRAVRQHQLRGADRDAARIRAVRPRPRRLHRRGAGQGRPVRGGRRRHDLPRRDRRGRADGAGQAAARPAGARDPPRRRRADHHGARPRRRRHQPRPARRRRRRDVPRGSLLPAGRLRHHRAAAARPARGHAAAGAPLPASAPRRG